MNTLFLPRDKWPLVAPVVAGEFNNEMPTVASQAEFFSALDGERLAGFVHIERLFHFNCVHIEQDYRDQAAGLAMRLIKEAVAAIPRGYSAVWFADRNVRKIAAELGARDIGEFRVYRKDA